MFRNRDFKWDEKSLDLVTCKQRMACSRHAWKGCFFDGFVKS
jgi:hypothetical protein